MLPLVLVLLVAQSAFGAPQVSVSQRSINEVAPLRDPGSLVSSYLTQGTFELLDGGELSVFVLTVKDVLADLANSPDALSQALAVGQTINLIAEQAYGNVGDACEYAAIVNAAASGNRAAIAQNLGGYVNRVLFNIDTITNLANNPSSLRFARGRSTGCNNAGRVYNFEAAWDRVLGRANPYQMGLLNEQYCNAKKLYNANKARINNCGAAITAASVDAVAEMSESALGPLANFLRVVAEGRNPAKAAALAKQAVAQAASYITV